MKIKMYNSKLNKNTILGIMADSGQTVSTVFVPLKNRTNITIRYL